MIRLAATLCLFAFPVMAQDFWSVPRGSDDPDDLEIRASEQSHVFAEIVYDNSAALSSQAGRHVLMWQGEAFTVTIELGGQEVDGAEIIRIETPAHLMALPDYAEVPDGEVFIVEIVQALF